MVENLLNIKVGKFSSPNRNIKVSGSFETHYAPNVYVVLNGITSPGDGFIALAEIPTPAGTIRLASPKDDNDYAQILYGALRLADSKGIRTVNVIPPADQGIGQAINNRLL
jgi:L-threonylcarbamoyladenylate synthase